MRRRKELLGPNVPTFYDEPVHIVRGEGVWLWDDDGRKYLDCYNNVPHVGHCNPRVVEAVCRQASTLNTHTRYLHGLILDYVERLTATMDDPLSTAVLTCTGSEANDVAMRMAEAVTGRQGFVATDCTYHGNTMAVSQLSRETPRRRGEEERVVFVTPPRGLRTEPPGWGVIESAGKFGMDVVGAIRKLEAGPHGFAGMVMCPQLVNEGFPHLPDGWLEMVAAVVRAAGGLFIADEVQAGFGRIGAHMWAHQRHGIVPDIVTLGKPMANGHPVGAAVTSAKTMAAFRKGCRYFNTFGGNPVSCAAAMAVLDELEEKRLVEHARTVGEHTLAELDRLLEEHACIGDVRGQGLILGAELVLDCDTMEPATGFTGRVVNEMRRRGVLLGSLGPHKNTLKIRPPMPFTKENADLLIETLADVLSTMKPDVP